MLASPFLAASLVCIVLALVAVLLGTPMRNILAVAALAGTVGALLMLGGCGASDPLASDKPDPCCITYQEYVQTMEAPTPTAAPVSKYQFQP